MIDLEVHVDDFFHLYADGQLIGGLGVWGEVSTRAIPDTTRIVAVFAENYDTAGDSGIAINSGHIWTDLTEFNWRCTAGDREPTDWTEVSYDDSGWPSANLGTHVGLILGVTPIWSENSRHKKIQCRGHLGTICIYIFFFFNSARIW